MLSSLLALQPRAAGGGGGGTQEEAIAAVAGGILEKARFRGRPAFAVAWLAARASFSKAWAQPSGGLTPPPLPSRSAPFVRPRSCPPRSTSTRWRAISPRPTLSQ
jgi:hypothetical protein